MKIVNLLKKHIGIVLLVLVSVIGLINYDNYGISWDEEAQRQMGIVSYDYVFSGNKALNTFDCRTYGVAIELPLVIIEKALGLQDSRTIYLTRHLLTHFLFLISAFCCFLLIDFLYKNKVLASIGFLLYILSPVLYAHSFFNSKDLSSAAMFMICFYLNVIAFSKLKIKYFLLLGIGVGLLINIRIIGIFLFCCILFFLLLDLLLANKNKIETIKKIKLALTFFVATILTLYISWPFLWENPIANFIYAFNNMAKFPWDSSVWFKGQFFKVANLTWDYIPVWFVITTPLYYLIAGLGGIILLFINFFKKPFSFISNTLNRNNLLFIICFVAPVLAVIILKSVLYDGWRQLFFIYPSFVLLVVYAIHYMLQTKLKKIIISITFIYFGYIALFMIANNPFQQVYFNELMNKSPEYIRSQFELDYWGASYKQSLEYILKEDKSEHINIAVANVPGRLNVRILPVQDRERINLVEIENAKYFITNYRWHPKDYDEYKQKKWHAIKVNNNTINEIFKLQ
jgi:hypothetical protein